VRVERLKDLHLWRVGRLAVHCRGPHHDALVDAARIN
jgi:hypothetical protein